ncbi:hypothetical protein [Occallatibacter riparius]|uniref:Uncharacterized protein n=1 Tax=Occallatibacter riparius TaxID=1002689 RepID=A0A9J7BUJ4_9BACT|nr:hypothetical protein [Occallatibacter riparius]UWZ85418.1 hypothetical protein MOP44_05625 [Occallatibacter riparius]
MTIEAWGMLATGVAALAAGLILARGRWRAASGAKRVLLLGPIFEAVALAMFAAEHFTAARELMGIVPLWLPLPLFWTWFVGVAWVAAAVSLIAWRQVRWSAMGTSLLMLIIVITVSLPGLSRHLHDRFSWILTVRETSFAGGAMVLAGSVWGSGETGRVLMRVGRWIVALVMVFYAIEHFLYPRFVPGVPLEKPLPGWVPGGWLLAYVVGASLLAAGIGLMVPRKAQVAAAGCGTVLLLLTAFFYVPMFFTQMQTPAGAVEGLNYIGDTMLFAATVLLAGRSAERRDCVGDRRAAEPILTKAKAHAL